MKLDNIFKNGKRVDLFALRKGAKSTDCHIFILNEMLKFLTEIQINYEDKYAKRLMRSRLINIAIMNLVDELTKLPEDKALEYVKELDQELKKNYN